MPRKKVKKNSRFLILLAVIIITTASIIAAKSYSNPKTEDLSSSVQNTNQLNSNSSSPPAPSSNPSLIPSPTPTPIPTTELSTLNYKIPILMYHHIRDFNDPSDQIGTNLSVPPEKFATQLLYITQQGYQTTTFEEIEKHNIPTKPIILTFDDGYENFYQNAYPKLKELHMKAVIFDITDYKTEEYMNESQLKEISDNGIEIGSHTLSHPDLSKINPAKAKDEIIKSKEQLEKILGKPVISFCYPSGKFNSNVVELVKEAGYKYAVTTQSGTSNFQKPYELSRFRLNNDTNITALIK